MNYVGRFFSTCKDFYNDINAATLTGAIDVIVVEQEDGSLTCSPFHVRFGKLGVLRYKGKTVDVSVNGEEVDLTMRLGDSGVAYFVDDETPIDDESVSDMGEAFELSKEAGNATASHPGGSQLNSAVFGTLDSAASLEGAFMKRHPSTDSELSFKSFQPIGSVQDDLVLGSKDTYSLQSLDDALADPHSRQRNMKALSKSMCRLPNKSLSNYPSPKLVRSVSTPDVRITEYFNQSVAAEAAMALDSQGRPNTPPTSGHLAEHPFAFSEAYRSRRGLSVDPNVLEGLHSLSDSELCHEGPAVTANERSQMSWPWGGVPTTERETTVKTKGESTPANASSTQANSGSVTPRTEAASPGEDQSTPKPGSTIVSLVSRFWSTPGGRDLQRQPSAPEGGVYLSELNTENLDPTTESMYFQRRQGEHSRTASLPTAVPSARATVKSDSYLTQYSHTTRDWADDSLSSSAPMDSRERLRPNDTCSDSGASSMPGSPPSCDSILSSTPTTPTLKQHSLMEAEDSGPDVRGMLCTPGMVELSACGGLKDSEKEPDRFQDLRISYEEFCNKPELLNNSSVVVRFNNRYYTWQAAAPILMSMVVFGKGLPERTHHSLMKQHMPRKRRFMWFWRGEDAPPSSAAHSEPNLHSALGSSATSADGHRDRQHYNSNFSSDDDDIGGTDEVTVVSDDDTTTAAMSRGESMTSSGARDDNDTSPVTTPVASTEPAPGESPSLQRHQASSSTAMSDPWREPFSFSEDGASPRCYLRLPSDKLKTLGLKEGANTFTFSVTTKYQGTTTCEAMVYLWHHSDKIVVSDVDGTITRSDVYGQVLPLFGQDWSQSGVAQLFSDIGHNGYRFIYLSARAIGQSKLTRDYLRNIRQGQRSLPDGPLLLNPSSLVRAFHREVIMKNPQEFKIAALRDIGSLFVEDLKTGPYYAGFGNRLTDVITYVDVGVPKSHIFTINPTGELRHEFIRTFKSSYTALTELIDQFFPPRDDVDTALPVQYNQFHYWRAPLPNLDFDT